MSVEPIKLVLIVEGEYFPAWQYLMLERLSAMRNICVIAVIFSNPSRPAWPARLSGRLLAILKWLDAFLFRCPRAAQRPRSVLDLLGDVAVCMAGSLRYQYLIQTSEVDVVLDMTAGTLLPETLGWAKQGVWRHFYGQSGCHTWQCHTWQVLGVTEYASRRDSFILGIERFVASRTDPECLYQAVSSMHRNSLNRSIEPALWKMADFVPQCLVKLAANKQSLQANKAESSINGGSQFNALVLVKLLWRYPDFLFRKLYQILTGVREQWILLIGRQRKDLPAMLEPEHCQRMVPPADRFWADPMLVEHPSGNVLFFEELLYTRGRGHIACMRLDEKGEHERPVKVLERSYHLSYPFVFEWQEQYYMIPETAENRTVELYRCETFPDQWVFEKNLMEGVEAFDATLHEHAGRWWMFVNMRKHPGESPHESLYLFYADHPLSTEWHFHPQNPVVASATSARPAGRLVSEGNVLYRPSQDCAGGYGHGISLNVVRQLDIEHYREELVSYQPCGQGSRYEGVHTLALGKGITVMDALQPVYRNRFGQWMSGCNHA